MEILSDGVFRHVSDTQTPQGILCIVKQQKYEMDVLLAIEKPHFMVLDNLQDPGNLGTIVRTAEGAGVDAVFMSKDCVDIYNPKTVRSAMGSLFRVKITRVGDLGSFISAAQSAKREVYAAELSKRALPLGELSLSRTDLVMIGNEGHGIPEEISSICTGSVYIPISKNTESLNAAVAAALFMWEQSKI